MGAFFAPIRSNSAIEDPSVPRRPLCPRLPDRTCTARVRNGQPADAGFVSKGFGSMSPGTFSARRTSGDSFSSGRPGGRWRGSPSLAEICFGFWLPWPPKVSALSTGPGIGSEKVPCPLDRSPQETHPWSNSCWTLRAACSVHELEGLPECKSNRGVLPRRLPRGSAVAIPCRSHPMSRRMERLT